MVFHKLLVKQTTSSPYHCKKSNNTMKKERLKAVFCGFQKIHDDAG